MPSAPAYVHAPIANSFSASAYIAKPPATEHTPRHRARQGRGRTEQKVSQRGPATEGFSQGTLDGPSKQETALERVSRKADMACPVSNGPTLAPELNDVVSASVVGLLRQRRPTNVSRLVVTLDVRETIQGHPWRAWPYVGKKSFETISPSVAHRDAERTIVPIRELLLVVAARFGCAPRAILTCVALVMRCVADSGRFVSETATTKCIPDPKMSADHDGSLSAKTQTEPSGLFPKAWLWWGSSDNGESSERLAGQVNRNRAHVMDSSKLMVLLGPNRGH